MNHICIPIPKFNENEIAEVVVTLNGENGILILEKSLFRGLQLRIMIVKVLRLLKKMKIYARILEEYDKGWELFQFYKPPEKVNFIQVLFKQK